MNTWNEPTDIEVEHANTIYKVRRVTRGYRVWRQGYNGWIAVREGKLHDEVVALAEDEVVK